MDDLQRDAAGIGALADPVRRQLYRFVCSQAEAVSRDQAAEAVGIPRHQAKFHLDRLAAEGLLDCDYARLTGRSGPGAGRPSKLYRRAGRDIAVSLPQREYELAGRLMADALAESAATGVPAVEVLHRIARDYGRAIAQDAERRPRDAESALQLAAAVLTEHGYEPRRVGAEICLANCPFHTLARRQTELACGMNHALIAGVAEALAPHSPHTRLDPHPDRCCVVLTAGP
ncbi:helix-turn-helix transcriptional regulator [Mycobacterium branderi]|uniref:Transcriptional regulator n=1 Tax=Mycobacterium branderi TaxID=43348 RepID=A0A7I7WCI1_9MYCO|nr:helix-turn-helix domain-containing protein [Mycobacterium branderi]MCV7232216.1 helix-turn-helix domain-containing protein [Mycobacterium branderi]ORA33783.1 transcriptional regulator [Mycobacterium branderi]BBZ14233.1 transcriptional regulator [Mycobacterium branderi]